MLNLIRKLLNDIVAARSMPRTTIDLMHSATKGNDPFYEKIVREFYEAAHRRHRKFPLIRSFEYGIAVCNLPRTFDEYFMLIEAAGRRNYKKAKRLGHSFGRIDPNEHLTDIKDIWLSTDCRQGALSGELAEGNVTPCTDPASLTTTHDYPYFAVLNPEGKVMAYASCLIAGEACMIEQIFGHADHQSDGVVPMLIAGIAEHAIAEREFVKYCTYDKYFGASENLRRFKRKFKFLPHRVKWVLG